MTQHAPTHSGQLGLEGRPAIDFAYLSEVMMTVEAELTEYLQRSDPAERPEPRDLAKSLTASLPAAPDELDPHFKGIGPFYDTEGAIVQLGGISKQALAGRRERHTVLAMKTKDGFWLYPAWQFTGDGHVHDVLLPVVKELAPLNGWSAGVWLVKEHPDLNGRSPRKALAEGTPPADVAKIARQDVHTLTGP